MQKSASQSVQDKSPVSPHVARVPAIDAEERHHMIAEAAYFRAEHRGFDGGDPVQDWLAAEVEIDRWISGSHPARSEETAAYLRLREEFRKGLSRIQGAIDAATLKQAFETGLAELKHLEEFSAEAIRKAGAMLREDMGRAADRMGPGWEHFSEHSAGLFSVWKDRSRGFLSRSADAVRDWLHHEDRGQHH